MKNKSRVLVVLSIAIMGAVMSSMVFAEDGDIHDITNLQDVKLKYTSDDLAISGNKQKEVTLNQEEFGYEYNNKVYPLTYVNDVYGINEENKEITLLIIDKSNEEISKKKLETDEKPIEQEQEKNVANNLDEFYNILKLALENVEENVEIKIPNYDSEYSLNVLSKICIEHPEVDYGYTGVSGNIHGYQGSSEKVLDIKIEYRLSKDEMIQQKRDVQAKIQQIISEVITENMKLSERELALHDYIVKNAEYNEAGITSVIATDHNAYGVLCLGSGVCESYAKATYELFNAAGIECKYAVGKGNGGNHAWNMVKLEDGYWYNIDVTWDDPVFNSDSGKKFTDVSYDYFNLNNEEFNKTHISDSNGINYPECNGTEFLGSNMDIEIEDLDGNIYQVVKEYKVLDEKIGQSLNCKDKTLIMQVKIDNMNANKISNRIKQIAEEKGIYGFEWKTTTSGNLVKVIFNWN